MNVEELAKVLHEAGREAVEKGKTVGRAHDLHKPFKWLDWDELHEDAKEGRRIQARYLLNHLHIQHFTCEYCESRPPVVCQKCKGITPYGLSYQEDDHDWCPECWAELYGDTQ